jgi:hypothetical protein
MELNLKLFTAPFRCFLLHKYPRRTTSNEKSSLARRLVSKNSQAGRSQHGAVMVIVFLKREVSQSSKGEEDLESYVQLAKTHWKNVSRGSLNEDIDGKAYISDESSLICCG